MMMITINTTIMNTILMVMLMAMIMVIMTKLTSMTIETIRIMMMRMMTMVMFIVMFVLFFTFVMIKLAIMTVMMLSRWSSYAHNGEGDDCDYGNGNANDSSNEDGYEDHTFIMMTVMLQMAMTVVLSMMGYAIAANPI